MKKNKNKITVETPKKKKKRNLTLFSSHLPLSLFLYLPFMEGCRYVSETYHLVRTFILLGAEYLIRHHGI